VIGWKDVPVSLIDAPELPIRLFIDKEFVTELGMDMRKLGQLQNIIVRPKGDRYEVIVGHTRYLAAKESGMEALRALVVELDDYEALQHRLRENVMRRSMGPVSEALTLALMKERSGKTWKELAVDTPFSEDYIARRVRLLHLPEEIQGLVEVGELGPEHALSLLRYRSERVRPIIEKESERTRRPFDQIVKELMTATARKIMRDRLTVQASRALIEQQLYLLAKEAVPPPVGEAVVKAPIQVPPRQCLICGHSYGPEHIDLRWVCAECFGLARRYVRRLAKEGG